MTRLLLLATALLAAMAGAAHAQAPSVAVGSPGTGAGIASVVCSGSSTNSCVLKATPGLTRDLKHRSTG